MARDKFHGLVRTLLEADGWTITDDPYILKFGTRNYEIDMGAERLLAAERGPEKILVEVKSFLSLSIVYQMHEAVGQYGNYRRLLRLKNDSKTLILALPTDAFDALFLDELGQLTIQEEDMKFLVFDPNTKSITQWIK